MYGTPSPQGFIPVFNENTGMTANAELTFPIANGYAQNIFTGDLVILQYSGDAPFNATTGYMASAYEYASIANDEPEHEPADSFGSFPLLGVFTGCSYVSPTDITNPDLPRRTWWPASTQSVGTYPPYGWFIPVNALYTFTVQCGSTAPSAALAGKFIKAQFTVENGLVQGDVQTGQSSMYVLADQTSPYIARTYDTIQVMGLDMSLNAGESGFPNQAVAYGNVLVRLSNNALPVVTNYPVD